MVKFLHAADIHLDSPLRGLERYEGAPAERIRLSTRRALENLVDLALGERVDFVLLAGDLYDGDWPDYNTGLYFVRQMARLREADIKVFIIAGNHDAANKMTRALPLPGNVVMLGTEKPESLPLDHLGVAIHGQGFPTPAVTEDLTQRYPAPIRGLYNIGLLHTCVEGAEGHSRYAPCSAQGLAAKGYDYWALGHIHRRDLLSERPWIVFPGNIQGRHVREAGPKGCMIVTLADAAPARVEFRRLDVVRWEICEVAASGAEQEEELAERVSDRLAQLLASEESDRLLAVRILVQGPSRLHERLLSNPERCTAELRARAAVLGAERLWVEQVKIRTRPPRESGPVFEGPIEELLAVLEEMRGDGAGLGGAAGHLADLRQKLPAEVFQDTDIASLDDPAWLRGVLDSAEAILRARLHH